MANNQEMYCNHCRRVTTFYLDSDLLWTCDECDNVHGSLPSEENHSHIIVVCPNCGKELDHGDLDDDDNCPYCGYEITSLEEDSVRVVCDVCGESFTAGDLDDNLCPACGSSLFPKQENISEDFVKCKYCNNIHRKENLIDGTYCPTCMEEIELDEEDDFDME